jgi:heterotetrameric sarcosine oxidase gamma subunit
LLLAAPGRAADVAARVDPTDDRLVTVQDFTHGRALVRLTGGTAAEALSKLCAVDLGDRATPDGRAFRSSAARVTTDVVRDDVAGTRSYLLHCERSSAQYLFDVLLDAGREFGIERDGFPSTGVL